MRALAIERNALPDAAPASGGGTARLIGPDWAIWAKAPARFEAGTPAIVNVIAFAVGLQLSRRMPGAALLDPAPASSAASILSGDDLGALTGQALLGCPATDVDRRRRAGSDGGGGGAVHQPRQRRQHADVRAGLGGRTPGLAAARAPAARDRARGAATVCRGARRTLADHEVVFTANTTEAVNLVAECQRREPPAAPDVEPVVLNTLLEHNSNELPWRTNGLTLVRLSVDREGFVDLAELEATLRAYNERAEHGRKRIRLVAVSGASNVLGSFNDLPAISEVVHRYGARLLVDAAQLVAHRRVEVHEWGIDALVFSAHKVYAPFGTGVLVVRRGWLDPAELERARASGEENVGGIAALGKALVLLQRIGWDVIEGEERALTARALRGLSQLSGVRVYGVRDADSPRFARKGGVIAFDMKRPMAHRIARELAERGGIGVRAGCHCAHLLIKRLLGLPPSLERLQWAILTLLPRFSPPGVARLSFGLQTRVEELDRLMEVLGEISNRRPAAVPLKTVRQRIDRLAEAAVARVYAT